MSNSKTVVLYLCFISELFGNTNTGINFDKYEDIPVDASGENCPNKVELFSECNFSEIIQGNIEVCKHPLDV